MKFSGNNIKVRRAPQAEWMREQDRVLRSIRELNGVEVVAISPGTVRLSAETKSPREEKAILSRVQSLLPDWRFGVDKPVEPMRPVNFKALA